MLIELGSLPKAVCRDLEVLFFIYIGKAIPIDFTKQSHINSQKQQKHFYICVHVKLRAIFQNKYIINQE